VDGQGSTVLAVSRADLDTAARGAGKAWSTANQEPIMNTVEITLTLTETQAWELAQFFKRVCFSDYRGCATSEAEAYHMRDAGEHIRRALADQGYAPR
jgi:hypothetical protein